MQTLVRSIQKKWLSVKTYAANRCRHIMPDVAKKLDECKMFTGEETLPELADLLFSPQGKEFMLANKFPNLATFRKFLPYHPEQYKIYIDCGCIKLEDPGRCLLVGNTQANIICKATQMNNIILMYGARTEIKCYEYALIKIEKDTKSRFDVFTYDKARVL